MFASETCALDIVGAKFVREIENGETRRNRKSKVSSIKNLFWQTQKPGPCTFEHILCAVQIAFPFDGNAYDIWHILVNS